VKRKDRRKGQINLSRTENLSSIKQNHVTEISETTRPGKSSIDEASQHLAHMFDVIDAEDIAMKANQEEILC
jgi:propanediol dehydratase small subunit